MTDVCVHLQGTDFLKAMAQEFMRTMNLGQHGSTIVPVAVPDSPTGRSGRNAAAIGQGPGRDVQSAVSSVGATSRGQGGGGREGGEVGGRELVFST